MEELLKDFIGRVVGEKSSGRSAEYKEAEREYQEKFRLLKDRLPEPDRPKLSEMCDSHARLLSVNGDEWLLAAFRFGALFMAEIYRGRDEFISG